MIPQRLHILKELLEKEPTDSFLNYALALEYAKENDLPKAIAVIETIIARDPAYLASYYQLGKLYEQQNEIQKALFAYNQGLVVAQQQKNQKTVNELREAIFLLEE